MQQVILRIRRAFFEEQHIAPLAVLRMAFGAIMLISTVRFMLKGWVYDFYIAPKVFFPFYGFEWVKPLPAAGMYLVFILMAAACLLIMTGLYYRIASIAFFLCFLYVELLDKTYYLNHYYFVNIISFLLLLVPAHRYCSLDVWRRPGLQLTKVPGWMINLFRWQLCLVYFYAGLSKLNADWLLRAMPMKIWLPANDHLPVIGPLLDYSWIAFAFSWFGAFFDLVIGFFLMYRPTRKIAYLFVVIFHVFTGWLFKIGMFPYIMIFVTVIFFSEDFHKSLTRRLNNFWHKRSAGIEVETRLQLSLPKKKILYTILCFHALIQLLLPFRFLLYPGKLYWTEEGYRFSWRVMLMEKSGTAFFYIKDPATGRKGEVNNSKFLTPMQEKMMATQPDMMVQYAQFLRHYYEVKGLHNPVVTAESYVTLNGSGSRLYIDSAIDLSRQTDNFLPKKWILPFH